MCRLSAIVHKPQQQFQKGLKPFLMKTLLLTGEQQGNTDGTGVAIPTVSFKSGKTASKALETELFQEHMPNLNNANHVLGHVRAISKGTGGVDGAHPFMCEDVYLAHNGTFRGYESSEVYKKLVSEIEHEPCDSEVFLRALISESKTVTVESIKTVTKKWQGSFALVIIQKDNLFLVRGTNPLHKMKVTTENREMLVVNTSKEALENLRYWLENLPKVWGYQVETGEPEKLTWNTVEKYTNGEHTETADLPREKGKRNVTKAYTTYTKNDKSEVVEKAEIIIEFLKGLTWTEVEGWAEYVMEKPLSECSTEEIKEGLSQVEDIMLEFRTPEKVGIAESIETISGLTIYEVDAITSNDTFYPYVFHTVEELEKMLQEVEEVVQ